MLIQHSRGTTATRKSFSLYLLLLRFIKLCLQQVCVTYNTAHNLFRHVNMKNLALILVFIFLALLPQRMSRTLKIPERQQQAIITTRTQALFFPLKGTLTWTMKYSQKLHPGSVLFSLKVLMSSSNLPRFLVKDMRSNVLSLVRKAFQDSWEREESFNGSESTTHL